jgi:REP-associated tyrosine transposase
MFGSHLSAERLEEIRSATNGGYVFGSRDFKRVISQALGRRVEKGTAGRPVRADAGHDQLDLLQENVVRP